MRNRRYYPTRTRLAMFFCALAVCAGGGCWEKIEYRGPIGTTATSGEKATAPAAVGNAPSDVPNERPQPASTAGERYTAKSDGNPDTPPTTEAEAPLTETPAVETTSPEAPSSD